ncbi:MAG: acyl-CoA dehydrogenase family protein, partial [Ilumatobacteraceae bacterium]
MRPVYELQAEEYREKVQAFLAEKLPSNWQGIGSMEGKAVEEFVAEWRNILASSPYLAPGWPVEYGGGGLSALEQVIVAEEFARAGVPTGSFNDTFGIQMLGNTLLIWGTEEQKRYYLPRIISGQDVWCQGYSEPNAGSDLGNVGLKATLDGDQFVLN